MRLSPYLKNFRRLTVLLFAGVLAACADESTSPPSTSPPVTESLLLPSYAATVEGNAANFSPFKNMPARFQAVYGTALLRLPVGATITGMRFRLDASVSIGTGPVTISNFEVRLSTSAHQPGLLSATFAANRGTDEVVVRTGPLTIGPDDYPVGGFPNAFGPTIEFSQPFVYKGGPLLLEIGYTGLPRFEGGPVLVDAVVPATVESQSAYGSAGGFNATTADLGLFQDLTVVEYLFVRP